MDIYQASLTSVPAPLILVQGISDNLRPKISTRRIRTLKEQTIQKTNEKINYGVQITIDRELDDLNNLCANRLINLIDNCNLRDKLWWPNQDSSDINNVSSTTTTTTSSDKLDKSPVKQKQKQQNQLTRQRLITSLNTPSSNSKGLWFNIKYVDKNYDIIINGSKSPLSPYYKNNKYFGSLLPLEWLEKYYNYIPSVFISFYEIDKDEKFDDLLINEINRIKLKFSNTMIKFVCILINSTNSNLNDARIQNISTKINMNNNSLFIINGLNDEISKREQNTFIRKLMIGLKQYSNDFFNLQIQKLKKREIKDDQYSEKFFSARNLIKLAIFEQFKGISDYSTKLLEYAYDRLLQCLRSIDSNNQFKEYLEIKNWLDIMCIQIVRTCIALGDSNIAYRKFTFHVQQIRELDTLNLTFNWLSIQYTWLGELIENINENLIPVETVLMPTLNLKDIKFNSYNMPQNGFNYLQAFEYRRLSIKFNEDNIFDNSILLLTASLDSFNLSKFGKFSRIESRIYVLLGDIYFLNNNFSMAVNNYLAGLSSYKQENCMLIVSNILEKILNCYIGLSQIREAWSIYIELCCIDDFIWENANILNDTKKLLNSLKEKIISLDLINDDSQSVILDNESNESNSIKDNKDNISFLKEGVFNIDVDIKKYTNLMNDGIDLQMIIQHKGNKMISNLKINHLDIEIGENCEFKIIRVKNNDNINCDIDKNKSILIHELNCNSKEIKEEVSCSLEFKNIEISKDIKFIVLQLHILSGVVGKFYVPRVKINGTLNDIEFNTVINISGLDNLKKPFIKWYSSKEEGKYETLNNHYPTNSFEVLPKIPKIKCKLKYDRIGFNGRKFPILLKFSNEDLDSLIKINIKGICEFVKKYEITCKWFNGKEFNDDEFIGKEILKPGESIEIKCLINLPQISGLPVNIINNNNDDGNNQPNEDEGFNCNMRFDIKYELVTDGVSIDFKKEGKIKIVEMMQWHTELRADKDGDFPNLFLIDQDKMLDINDNMNIPVHTRRWLFTLDMKNLSFEDLNITSCKFIVRGPKGVILKLQPEIKEEDEEGTKLLSMNNKKLRVTLDISCYERIIKSVPVDVYCMMEYSIDELKEERQKYKLEMYKANLPHVDPRMLVFIEAEDNFGEFKISYIIENPTDRIFQYQTNLNIVKGIEIIDYVKSIQLNVMPFMREKLEFKYKINKEIKDIKKQDINLPEFTLYDRQFQVFVKPNIADDKLKFIDGQLFLKKNEFVDDNDNN